MFHVIFVTRSTTILYRNLFHVLTYFLTNFIRLCNLKALCLTLTYKTISFVIVYRKQLKENTEHSNYIQVAPFSSRNIEIYLQRTYLLIIVNYR